MMYWLRKFRRKPQILYIIAVILLYPFIQALHLVKLITHEKPLHAGTYVNVGLKSYLDNSNKILNHDRSMNKTQLLKSGQLLRYSSTLSITDISGDVLEELRQIHRELMEVVRSPLIANKTEAHDLNTQVLLMIKKINTSDSLQSDRAKLGAMVEVKDIVYKEMKLIRKFTQDSQGGVGRVQAKKTGPLHPNQKRPQIRKKVNVKPKPAEKEVKHCLKLNFVNPPKAVTALASYPGSGNTWLRHLIQEATGLMTGSIHSDPYLVKSGFPGEKTTNGKVVVVKIHSQPEALKGCSKAIVLLRNPYKSLLADFNRHNRVSSNEHTGHAPDNLFNEPDWKRRANILGADWYMFYDGWLEFNKPLLVLTYEDLKMNPQYHVERIVQFLGLNIPKKNYECMLNNTEGSYHRKHKPVEVNLFNKKQVDLVNLYSDMINEKLSKYNVTVDTTVPH